MLKEKARGFTLIELLVVIAIIGIIAVLILLMLSGTRVKARDVRRKSDVAEIVKVIEMYKDANAEALPSPSGTTAATIFYSTNNNWTALQNALNRTTATPPGPKIIAALPKDPTNDNDYGWRYYYKAGEGASTGEYEVGAYVELCKTGADDGGQDNKTNPNSTWAAYEVGTNLGIMPNVSGPACKT